MPNSESIFRLVTSGDLERLKDHVSMDRNTLFMSDRNGQTALHIAATEGLLDEASYLIESGCFVHGYDRAGRIPFHCAVKNNQQDMATFLLEMGTFPHMNTRSEDTALHISVENSLMEMSSWLMSLGSNLHYKNRDGDSPLHKAAYRGNVPILKNMTKFSPNLEIMNNAGDTPFLKAAMWGHISAVQFLFDAGANIHHINFKGDSALHLAALGGSISVVKWLLLQGVSISSENLSGNTAQDVARTNRIKELIRNVYNNGLGVIYNKGKDSNDEIKAQQEEESKVKILLREEIKEEMNMNARLLLEKELKLLNGEQGSQLSVKNAPKANSQTSAGQWSSYNGELVGDDIEEEKDFEIEELSVLGNLMSRRRPHIETNGAPGGMIPAPSSCASGVTDTAGTTIAGHRSDDTLSDDTELNDSMFSQNTSDYWNERANHYLSRMKNFAKKVEEYSSSDEDSVISEPATEKKHIPVKGKIEEFVTGAVFGMSDDEEYEQDDQDDLLSIDPRVDANNDDSSDDDDIFQQDQELSMMAQAGVVSDMEIETMNEDGSGVSDATLEGSSTDGIDEEQMSLERLIELQEQELAALMTEQQQMLVDLQRSQQDEVDTELLALIDSAEISELDDDGQELKVNEVRGLLTEKHGSQLRQLWNDHQTTLNAMRETHKFERMSFSFEYGNNEGKEGEAVEVTTEDAIIKQEQISMLEENIEVLRALLRESGVSPGGLLTSPSGIVSVKEQEGQEEQEVEEVSNEAICEVEETSNEVEVEEASNEVTCEAVDKDEQNQDMVNITAQSPSEQIIMVDLDETEQRINRKSNNRERLSTGKKRDSRDRSSNKMRLSKSPMTGKSGVKLLQTGKLAAGLGRSALQSLLGDESDSDSGDDDTSDITASSSEYYSSDDEEQSLRMRVQSNNDVINASSKRTLSDDLAAEEYTPPTPVEEPLEIQKASPVKVMPIVEAPIHMKEKENLNEESVVDKPSVTASPAPPTEGIQRKTPTTASPNKLRPNLRLSTGSRRSTGTAKSDQRLMASGQLAAGLGNTIMRSFMCDSDSDLSTQEDDNSSRSSSLSSGSWEGSQDGGSVSRDSEDEKEASNRVEEPEILVEPDFSDVSTSPDALKCETRVPPPAKMAMSSQHAPVANDSCPYEVKTVYDLSPVRMASPSPTKSPAKESKIVHSDEEQAKISMLEANIVALRALLRDSGVSPRDILVSSSNKQKEGRDVEEETDLITTIADDMSEDEKQRQRQQEVEDESRRVFDLIDLNKDGVVTKIELIKGLKSNCLNLPEVLNLPAHIRQEDGSRDNFMSVFHSMDKNNSSDISLSEFVEFCHNVRAHSSSNILPMIKESNGSESDPEEDADVSALKEAAGQAMQSTVDMLKKVMEDSDLFPTPDKVNAPVISSPKRPSTPDSVGDSRPGSNISPARSRVLTPMPSIGADVDQLSSFKTLATKLNILASYLLTESRASSLRDISDQINNMISEIEDDGDDDLEWGGVIGEEDKVAQLTVSCRKWKVDALSIVRGEIHALEERVSQIYTVFLE